MSLFSLANRSAAAVNRPAAPARPHGDEDFEAREVPAPTPPPAATTAIDRLVEFLPMETVTIFWLAVPAAALLASEAADGKSVNHPTGYDWAVYLVSVTLTPVLLLLKFLSEAKRGADGKLPRRADWPWWKMGAATAAFALWALAVPGNPFMTTPGQLMLMWAVAAVVTVVLGFVDKIFFP
jgi:hypothetical protein